MRTSVLPRGPRPVNAAYLPMPALLPLCLVCLAWACCRSSQLHFMPGIRPRGNRAAKPQVTQRSSDQYQSFKEIPSADGEQRKLTSKIATSRSPQDLMEALDEALDGQMFNFYHVSKTYHKLANWQRRGSLQESDWESSVASRLHAKVQRMMCEYELNSQATANVLWSLAKLSSKFSMPSQLFDALVKSMPTQARNMDEQQLTNCLLAIAKLKGQPGALQMVPAIVEQILAKAKYMVAQALSNCLWACLKLKDDEPNVLEILPALLAEIPGKITDMKPQEVSNSMEALLLLQDSSPEVAFFLSAGDDEEDVTALAAKHLSAELPRLTGKDFGFTVPVVVWACAKRVVYDEELLVSVSQRLGSSKSLSRLPDFGLCALLWSYEELDTLDQFQEFRQLLQSQVTRKGLSEDDVQSCRLGRFEWNRA